MSMFDNIRDKLLSYFNTNDEKGFRITIFATIKGINHRKGEVFKIKSGYTIFPNGQLKCNTLWGGEWK